MSQMYKNPYDRSYPPESENQEEEIPVHEEPMDTEEFVQRKSQGQDREGEDPGREIPINEEEIPAEESISFIQNDEPLKDETKEPKEEEEIQESEELQALRKEMQDLKLRQAADMENYKKRLAREHLDQLQYAAEKVLSDLLPTLDNLELALQYGNKSEVCKDLLQGVSMTHKLLLEAVQKHGLTQVGVEGEAFDPAIHEAVGFEAQSEHPQGSVGRVLQHGYKLANRLLRAAKVMVVQ